ncbi:exo-alpha-sialidase [Lentilactobacillus hilgardii]|nr:exo-alpha-sialidase [Lentilactobacillus hilgardii]
MHKARVVHPIALALYIVVMKPFLIERNVNMFKHKHLGTIAKLLFAFSITLIGGAITTHAADTPAPFGPVKVYQSPAGPFNDNRNYGARSPRVIQLEHQANPKDNGKLLLTFEKTEKKGVIPSFPIYESDDNGKTWSKNPISEVKETQNQGWGMANCPQLYELPEKIGDMPAGTIVVAGDATPNDYSRTNLEMYTSSDVGKSWMYKSTIVQGGDTSANFMGKDPVWEPFITINNHKLIVFYSDERNNDIKGSQQLVHQETSNGTDWGELHVDVAAVKANNANRPGMVTIAKMDNGQYVMTMESDWGEYAKTTSDIEKWDEPDNWGTQINPLHFQDPVITNLNDGRIAYNDISNGSLLIYNGAADFIKKNSVASPSVSVPTQVGPAYNRWILPLTNGLTLIAAGDNTKDTSASIRVETVNTNDSTVQGKVIVHYVDENGQQISPDDVSTGVIGTSFDVTAKAQKQINGYAFQSITKGQNDVRGNFGADPIEVTATYQKNNNTLGTTTSSSSSSVQSSSPSTPIASSSSVSSSSSSTVSSTSSSTTATAPSTSVAKPFKVVATKALYRYNNVNFSKANRIKHYAKKSITKAPVFTVVATTKSSNGALRYQLSDGSYITTKAGYVTKLYNQAKTKTLRVINPKGTWEYKFSKLTKKSAVKHLKKSKVVKVKKLVRKGTATRYQLTNGHYVTGNKQFVKVTK